MQHATPAAIAVLAIELAPAVLFGCAAVRAAQWIARWPISVRWILPSLLALPYAAIAISQHIFQWRWFALYAVLPVAMAWLLDRAAKADPEQRGNWRDAIILLALGLAADLRWFDSAWPEGWRGLGNLLLVDAGLYGFLGIRRLSGTGFDFHLRWTDWKTGLRELLFFAPVVLALGLALGFIHARGNAPGAGKAILTWIGVFVFVAVPEELFFRSWVQNLVDRRVGRHAALVVASVLFGLSHFNKRLAPGMGHFNWRYVLLAMIAGIFYGRAWREQRRVPASAITHTFVDWIWTWWF